MQEWSIPSWKLQKKNCDVAAWTMQSIYKCADAKEVTVTLLFNSF